MKEVLILCVVVCISGFIIPPAEKKDAAIRKQKHGEEAAPETKIDSNGNIIYNFLHEVVDVFDGHTAAEVEPRAAKFSKKTGKKLKSKKPKPEGEWIPENVVTAPEKPFKKETHEEKEKRLHEEFNDVHKKLNQDEIDFGKELNGLEGLAAKMDKAVDWHEATQILSSLGEVGQETLKRFPEFKDEIMVPEKHHRQAAVHRFLERATEIKAEMIEDKKQQRVNFQNTMPDKMWESYEQHHNDKARRLQEYDEAVKRRQMRGMPRRPLGHGEPLPGPKDADAL